jgi:hypothetical protein
MKKNSKGQWKDRYCLLTADTFSARTSKEDKENIDIKLIAEVAVIAAGTLEIKMLNGEVMLFQASEVLINKWCIAFTQRVKHAMQAISVIDDASADKVLMSGRLMKKSHNKYQTHMQV